MSMYQTSRRAAPFGGDCPESFRFGVSRPCEGRVVTSFWDTTSMPWKLIYLPQIIKNHSSIVGIVARFFFGANFPRNFLQSLGAYIVWVLSCTDCEALYADRIFLSRPKYFYHEMLSIFPEFNLHGKSCCRIRHRALASLITKSVVSTIQYQPRQILRVIFIAGRVVSAICNQLLSPISGESKTENFFHQMKE